MLDEALAEFSRLMTAEMASERQGARFDLQQVDAEWAGKGHFNSAGRLLAGGQRLSERLAKCRDHIFKQWTTYIQPRLDELSATDQHRPASMRGRGACSNGPSDQRNTE
jgi:hypothetical protein